MPKRKKVTPKSSRTKSRSVKSFNPKPEDKDYVTLKDIVIPAGTVFRAGPTKMEMPGGCHEAFIGFDNGSYAGFVTYEDDMQRRPDLFTVLHETVDIE